jgi:hypothetical protein
MTERRQLLLESLSGLILEVLPWSLSGLICLYLLWGYVSQPVRTAGKPVGEYVNEFTPANFPIRPKDALPQRYPVPAMHDGQMSEGLLKPARDS